MSELDISTPPPYEQRVAILLQTHLSLAVPLAVRELVERGGPTEEDFDRARQVLDPGVQDEAVLYHIKGKTGPAVTKLVQNIAIASFCPGGISAFGLHFHGPTIARQFGCGVSSKHPTPDDLSE